MEFLEVDNMLRCSFFGRLDENVCSGIEQSLLKRVSDFKQGRISVRLTFDLAEVVYISSAFLRICLMCYRTFGQNSFTITNVSDEIHHVFHISGFSEIMNIARAA